MRYQPVHHTIVAVDVVASGGLDDRQLLRTRADLRDVLRAALAVQSIDLDTLDQTDLGDGLRFLAPSTIPPNVLLDPFVLDLDAQLGEHRTDTSRIRLRVAIHHGLVHRDGDEWAGAPLVMAARLLDAAPVRHAIRSAPEANLVLVVSQSIYDDVVRHGYGLEPGRYQPIRVVEKETSTSAWVFVPGGGDAVLRRSGPRSGPALVGSMPLKAGFFQHRLAARQLEAVIRPGQTAVLSQVLTGLGGVGKTQLAADYARRSWQAGDVDLIVWVTAMSREAVISRYAEAADVVDGGHQDVAEHAAQRFLRWMATETNRRWLVVLDDLSKPSVLDGLWPPASIGRTVVTTRRRDAALASQGRHLVEVGMFTDAEARGYLQAVLADHAELADDVNGLAADLGYLPLALSHAAAFMIDRQLTCSAYRSRFHDQRRRLADLFPEPEALPDQYHQTVGATWSLSIEVADALRPVGVARPLIELASVLDPNGTPDAVFRTNAALRWIESTVDGVDEADARDGLYCLHRLNLAAVNDGVVRVHALVQRAVVESLGHRAGPLRQAAAAALHEAWTATPTLGWQLLSTLVKVADDARDASLLRQIFDRLLAMLDGRVTESLMHRAWDATYVIEDNFAALLPLVLQALDGEPLDPDSSFSSHLGEPARITQAAASSLAATFVAIEDPASAEPERAIGILARGLQRWSLRKRFVEALALYRDPRALAAVLDFTEQELAGSCDHGVLGALAAAIGELGQTADDAACGASIAALKAIGAIDGLDLKTTRAVRTSLTRLRERTDDIPEVSDAEVIECLNPSTFRGSYSDWVDAREAADHAYRRVVTGRYPPEMVTALLYAFGHPNTGVRPAVARCLGRVDEPQARSALLTELLKPGQPAEVRQACLYAFGDQIRTAGSPQRSAVRRWQALDAAARATAVTDVSNVDLARLALPDHRDEPRVTHGAIELATDPAGDLAVSVVIVDAPAADASAVVAVDPVDVAAVGPDLEDKYRIRSVSLTPRGWRVELARTTWTESASFHRALLRREPLSIEECDRALHNLTAGADLPGLASMHCIVVTGDHKVVLARRPYAALYSPGRWSVSFEEQLTTADLAATEDPIRAAARRGLVEEFGIDGTDAVVSVHSAVLEVPILNRCLLAIVTTPATSGDIRLAWSNLASSETMALYHVEAAPDLLRAEAQRPDLQPTAALRLLTLADVLAGTQGATRRLTAAPPE